MRKLTITRIELEYDGLHRTHSVAMCGVFVGVEVRVKNTMGSDVLESKEIIELSIQACVHKFMQALEPTEVVYEKEATNWRNSYSTAPVTPNPFMVSTTPATVDYIKTSGAVYLSNGTVSGAEYSPVSSVAQTTSTT